MRLNILAFVALSGTWFAHGLTVMGNYEIRPAGDGSSSPYGKVLTVSPFLAETYFESKSTVPGIATFELFANPADGAPCSSGALLSNSTYNVTTITGPSYTKTGSNSRIYAAQYSIPDVTTTPAYDDGKVNLCARAGIKKEYDSSSSGAEYVSYVDTLLVLNVDFTAKFSNFSQTVNISATAMGNLTENVTKSVEVEAVLCAKGASAPSTYKIGQDFSICVSPKDASYVISNFTNVTCENTASSRQLVVNTAPDILTTTSLNITGYLNASGSAVGGDGGVFSSVVTAGYFGNGEKSFTCSGEASLSVNSPDPPCTFQGSFLIGNTTIKGVYGLPMCVREMATSFSYRNQYYLKTATLKTNVPEGYGYKAIYTSSGLKENDNFMFGDYSGNVSLTGVGICGGNSLYIQPSTYNLTNIDYGATFSVVLATNRAKPSDMISTCIAFPQKKNAEQKGIFTWLDSGGNYNYQKIQGGFSVPDPKNSSLDPLKYDWYCPNTNGLDATAYFKSIQQEETLPCPSETKPNGRRLNSVGFTHEFEAGALARELQESSGAPKESGSFASTVGLSENGPDGLTASAMFYGGWTATVAGLIAAVLSTAM